MRGIVAAHNTRRARHCAPPLTWSPAVAKAAQRWADTLKRRNCAFGHSPGFKYGENLAFWSRAGLATPDQVVEGWYSERKLYSYRKPGFDMRTGHFTQVVWRSTTKLGCGVARCRNGAELWVCNYAPAGNFQGRYRANVLSTRCNKR